MYSAVLSGAIRAILDTELTEGGDQQVGTDPARRLPADLIDLCAEVVSQVPRLLMLQDRDPDSPMRGCMHPAYWRDKSSELADMRRQEVALALALLWRFELPGNRYCGDPEVLKGALRAMGFWTRMQNHDGTFDEWYKGEHGYAATAFSSYAMSLATRALGEALPAGLRADVLACLDRAGRWLTQHDDWFKTNHEAVGVAALSAIGCVLDNEEYRATALRNASRVVDRMHDEGWSSEISALDIGYTFLLVEYMGMASVLLGDTTQLDALRKAYAFAAGFLHPNLTTGAEYGICGNSYFSRVATVILAPHDPVAAGVLEWMRRPMAERDTSMTLKDDLRLSRYAYQPILAALLYSGAFERLDVDAAAAAEPVAPEPPLFQSKAADRWYASAKLHAVSRNGYAAWLAPCYGGFVRIAFRDGDGFHAAIADRGYAIDRGGKVFRNAVYSLDPVAEHQEGEFSTSVPLVPCSFVLPPYLARVGLRIATSLPYGPRWSRWLIDQWRAHKGTALNQSAAGVSAGESPYQLERKVECLDDRIIISDRLTGKSGCPALEDLHMVLDGELRLENGAAPDVDRRIPLSGLVEAKGGSEVLIRKEISLRDGRVLVRLGS